MIRGIIWHLALILALTLSGSMAMGQTEKAPEIRKSGAWMNSAPLTMKSLKGKVVLIDFWAFDCAPCIEALPHVQALYRQYSSKGLVVIGVHVPRTDDEKNPTKLRAAVERMGIPYPVVADNAHKIWDDFRCDLWPTEFVVDQNGVIQFSHGGVGRYDDMEKTIQRLLAGH